MNGGVCGSVVLSGTRPPPHFILPSPGFRTVWTGDFWSDDDNDKDGNNDDNDKDNNNESNETFFF